MKIAQPERGGNGVRAAVVNQTFPWAFCPVRRITEPVWVDRPQIAARFSRALSRYQTTCCCKSSLGADFHSGL